MSTDSRIDRHLTACSALAGISALASLAPQAGAAVLHSGTVSLAITYYGNWGLDFSPAFASSYTAGYSYGSIDGSPYEFSIGTYSGTYEYFGANTAYAYPMFFAGDPTGYYADYLTAGTLIGSGTAWYGATPFTTTLDATGADMNFSGGPWPDSGPASGYVGVKIGKLGGYYYGWIGVSIDAAGDATVTGWAYEDVAGTAITAGAVPEPSSLALLAIGAGIGGLQAWRRRRDDEQTQARLSSDSQHA